MWLFLQMIRNHSEDINTTVREPKSQPKSQNKSLRTDPKEMETYEFL